MVEDYAYAETYVNGDPNLDIPDGSQWGDIGKKEIFFYIMLLIF
jgi:hypothetical protein